MNLLLQYEQFHDDVGQGVSEFPWDDTKGWINTYPALSDPTIGRTINSLSPAVGLLYSVKQELSIHDVGKVTRKFEFRGM